MIGCAVWAHPSWAGTVYSAKSRSPQVARSPLADYSRRFGIVEGNTTFYVTPTVATLQQWAATTPLGFQFCLKLPQAITHQSANLTAAIPMALDFAVLAQNLGERLGPCFAQLPPAYGAAQIDDLQAFLTAWPHAQVPLALEVRHLSWWHPKALHTLLQATQTTRVLLDTRPIYSSTDDPQAGSQRRKPQVPLVPEVTTKIAFVRYISYPDREQNLPYWQGWVAQWQQWQAQGIRVYFFVHCPQEQHSLGFAEELYRQLQGVNPGGPAPALPTQLSLGF